jgi:sodium/potassium-transporting ATPase subunit alpha
LHSQPVAHLLLQENFQNTYLGAILIAVAFLNAGIDYYQIQKSEAILASFLAMIPPACRVVRDGTLQTIPAADLVKGDVVLLVSVHIIALLQGGKNSETLLDI